MKMPLKGGKVSPFEAIKGLHVRDKLGSVFPKYHKIQALYKKHRKAPFQPNILFVSEHPQKRVTPFF